jgi:hypothetical protein
VAKDSDHRAGALDADKPGLLAGLFAEENEFDRRSLWRIGTWGVAAVGAVVLAVTSNQWSMGLRRDQLASADLSRQAQQIQMQSRESQSEARRLANAVDTLNSDRDRLFSRITVLEQGLDSVTGTIAKQAAVASAVPKPPPSVAPPPATMMPPSPGDSAQQASVPPVQPNQAAAPAVGPVASTAIGPEKPRADAAKPDTNKPDASKSDPAPGALPQISTNKPGALAPAVPLGAVPGTQSPAQPLGAAKSMMGPPDPAAPKLLEPSKTATAAPATTTLPSPAPSLAPTSAPSPAPSPTAAAEVGATLPKDQEKAPSEADANADVDGAKIQRTEFAVDLGGANSIGGLRALWRGLLKSNNAELAELRPIMVLREGNTGLGMQLRLVAGPLPNAADAARICASLVESRRACETTVFDGQRLAMGADEQKPVQAPKSSTYSKRYPKHSSKKDDPPSSPKQESSTSFSSLLGIGKR